MVDELSLYVTDRKWGRPSPRREWRGEAIRGMADDDVGFEALLLGDVAVPRGSPLCFLFVKVCCDVVTCVVSLFGSALSLRSLTARNWARSRAWTSGWTANAMATTIRVGLTTSLQRGALHARTRASQARIYEFRSVRDREVPFLSSGH